MKKNILTFSLLLCMLFIFTITTNATTITEDIIVETYATLDEHNLELYLPEGNSHTLQVNTDYTGDIIWESSNPEVASVENGEVTPLEIGETVITVICGELTDTCVVTVMGANIEVNSDASIAIYKGGTHQIQATCSLENALITYTSQDESIAKVSSTGKITGISSGETTIILSAEHCENKYVTVYIVGKTLSKPKISSSRTASGITITWSKVTGASKYELYRKVGTGSWSKVTTTTNRKYVDKNLSQGKKYYYKVKAIGTSHGLKTEGDFSGSVYRTISSVYKPETVTVKSTGYKSITISWTRVYPAKGYEIYRSTSKNGTYKKIKTIPSGSTLSYKDTGLTTGKAYYYKIKTLSGSLKSSYTTAKSAKPTLIAPKIKTTANVTSNTIKIKWEKVTGANGYSIYRRASTSNSWEKIATVSGGDTLTYTRKTTGRYYYSVIAYRNVNGKKVYGKRSESVRVRPLKTTSVSITRNGQELKNIVSWNKVSGATKYQVYKKVGSNGTWKWVTTTTATTYTGNVTHGVKIYWKVRPIYQYEGVTSYGEFSEVQWYMIYYNPNYSVYMTSDTDSKAYGICLFITNNGVSNMRIYSDNAYYYDSDFSSYDRKLHLVELESGYFNSIDYVDIQPGECTMIMFTVYGNNYTWYDQWGSVYFDFKYDGVKYRASSSAYYGHSYWEK